MQVFSFHFLFYSLIAAALALVYLLDITVYWYSAGFTNNFSVITLAMGLLFFALLVISCPKENSARGIILQFFALTHVLPSILIYVYGAISLKTGFIVLLAFLVLVAASSVRMPKLAFSGLTERHFMYGALALQSLIVLMVIRLQGFGSFNLDIMKVYDFRREVQDNLPRIFSMLNSWSGKVLLPLGLILTIRQRSYFILSALLLLMVLLFGLTQHKTTLILPLGALLIYITLQKVAGVRAIFSVVSLMVAISFVEVLVSSLVFNTSTPSFFTSLVVRRALFLPPLLNDYYVQLFNSEPFVFWAGILDAVFNLQYPLPMPPAFLVGLDFFGADDMSANTGFVGSGYANAGTTGAVLYAFFLGLAIAFVRSQAKRVGTAMVASVAIFPIYTGLTASDLPSTLISHGLLLNLLLLAFLPSRTADN
ncbi:hypothetical protein [Sulfitobacter pontiacus]|uniref:hypothetical protein n=1 Tax=Sulfitobacter pontiacus TaxID=60137 RepID=UPI0036DD545F